MAEIGAWDQKIQKTINENKINAFYKFFFLIFSQRLLHLTMLIVAEVDEAAWRHVDPRILKTSWNNLEKLVRQSHLSFRYVSAGKLC